MRSHERASLTPSLSAPTPSSRRSSTTCEPASAGREAWRSHSWATPTVSPRPSASRRPRATRSFSSSAGQRDQRDWARSTQRAILAQQQRLVDLGGAPSPIHRRERPAVAQRISRPNLGLTVSHDEREVNIVAVPTRAVRGGASRRGAGRSGCNVETPRFCRAALGRRSVVSAVSPKPLAKKVVCALRRDRNPRARRVSDVLRHWTSQRARRDSSRAACVCRPRSCRG